MQHVYSIRRVKQKIGSGSDEADGLGILIEDKKMDIKGEYNCLHFSYFYVQEVHFIVAFQ